MKRFYFTITIDNNKSIGYVDAVDLQSAQFKIGNKYFAFGANVEFSHEEEIPAN